MIPDEYRYPMTMSDSQSWAIRRSPPSSAGIVIGAAMLIGMAFVFAAMGAPGSFVAFALLIGILYVVGAIYAKGRAEERIAEADRAAAEARDRFRDEVAHSVKDSMKGTIKVRCRYCGGLNGEHDENCESCGAPL